MKENLLRMWRSGIAMLLALCMAIGMVPMTAFAADVNLGDNDGTINYVALGASNTNGFGLMGYLPDELYGNPVNKNDGTVYGYQMEAELAYPTLVKDALEQLTGNTVELEQLAISSMRAEELHVLLDNSYDGDAYTEWRFTAGHNWFNMAHPDGLDGLRAEYQNYVANADVITVDIGANNFGVYASNRIFNNMFDADFTRFDEGTQRDIAAVKAEIEKILNEYATGLLSPELSGMLDHIVETMTYALVGFCVNFDASMKRIYELNPDATVVVVNIQNLMHDLYATLPGLEEPFAFGEFYGAIVNMANTYIATMSPYADKYYCAYIGEDGQAETFLKDIQDYTGNPEDLRTAVTDCFDVYDNDMYAKTQVLQALVQMYLGTGYVELVPEYKYTVEELTDLSKFSTAVYDNAILIVGVPVQNFLEAGAKDQLGSPLDEIYAQYKNALLTVYDTAATFMQLGANSTVLDLAAAASNFGDVGKEILQTLFAMLIASMENPGLEVENTDEFKALAGDPVAMAIITLGVRSDLGNSFFSHPNENGHVQIKDAIMETLENQTSGKEIVLETAIDLIVEYYDEAYAYAYTYAADNGYIADAVAAIDGVIAALENIDVPGTDAFQSEVAAEIEEIIETLESAKTLLTEADVLDQASLNALLALLEEAGEAMAQLLNVLEQAGADVNNLVIIPALEAAYDHLVNVVIPETVTALKAAVKAGTEYLVEKLGDAYDALVEATIEAVKKYAPELADAIYDYLYNNPEEVIGFFKTYGPTTLDLIDEYGDEALMVVGYVLYNYGDEIAAYIVENHEVILAAIVSWSEVHGENTIALMQVYAEALGLCDAVRDQIAELENALEALEIQLNVLKAELETAAGELKAELEAKIAALEAKIAEIKAEIEALKAAVDAAIKQGLADLETLKAAIESLDEKVAALIAAAEKAAIEEIEKAIDNVKAAIENLDEVVAELAGEVYDELKAVVKGLVEKAIDQLKEYAPELADAIYDYLYNNPAKVIAFVREYSDLICEYGEKALAVMGYLLYTYGDEIVEYIVEYHEEILETMISWLEVHGENTWALIRVYLEELDILEALPNAGDIQAALDKILGLLDKYVPEIKEDLQNKGEDYLNKLLAQVNALLKQIEEELKLVEGAAREKLEALYNKALALKACIEQMIEDGVNAVIGELQAAVKELEDALKAALGHISNEIKDKVEELLNTAKDLLDISEYLDALMEHINELIALIEKELNDATGEAKEKLEALYQSVLELKAVIEQMIQDGTTALVEKLLDAVNDVIDAAAEAVEYVSQVVAEKIEEIVDAIVAEICEMYETATHDTYVKGNDSFYVALGDGSAVKESYVELLAEELDVNHLNLAEVGLSIEDTYAILNANASEIAKADLVTVGFGNNGFTDFTVDMLYDLAIMNKEVDLDWTVYVGAEGAAYIEEALIDLHESFVESGMSGVVMGMDLAEMMTLAVESYAYSYVSYAFNLPEVVDAIHEISPEALVIIVGMYNPMADVVIDVDGTGTTEIAIGDYLQYLVDAANVYTTVYAMLAGDAIYVDAPDVQTDNVMAEMNAMQFIMQYAGENSGNAMNPSEEGHEYIKTQIMGALDVLFEIYGASMTLGNDLSMNFFVEKADLNGTDYYIEVIKTYADGRDNVIERYEYAEFVAQGDLWKVTFDGIAAKEMADMVYVTVYNGDGTAASAQYEDSIRAYAMRLYDSSSATDALKTVAVDMLNYGAAAQTYFEYNAADLANNQLTEEQQAYATKEVTCTNSIVKGDKFYGSVLSLESNIVLNLYFLDITEDMSAVVTYENYRGNEKTIYVSGSEFTTRGDLVGIVVDDLVIADGYQKVTCTVYAADGETVVGSVTESMESNIARSMEAYDDAIFENVMKFVTSARDYLLNK